MRIRVPRRFLLMGILVAALALVATTVATTPSFAKPINWNDPYEPEPPPPKGDTDGGLQKAGSITSGNTATGTAVIRTSWTTLRMYLAAMRLGYGWRWTW